MNNELGSHSPVWVTVWYLSEGTEEYHRETTGQPVGRFRFEPGKSQIQSAIHWTATFGKHHLYSFTYVYISIIDAGSDSEWRWRALSCRNGGCAWAPEQVGHSTWRPHSNTGWCNIISCSRHTHSRGLGCHCGSTCLV